MFGPEVVWVNNFGLVRAVSALYALSTLSVLREAAGDQLSRYRSAAHRGYGGGHGVSIFINIFCYRNPSVEARSNPAAVREAH